MPGEEQETRSSSVYNIKFAVPEMAKSIRAINSKLIRDIYLLFGLIVIFLISPFAADSNKLNFFGQLFYISFTTLTIKVLALFFLCLSIFSNILKLYLLYRQLDDEVKIYFSAPSGEYDTMITKSSHMTPFIISDTFFSDVIFTGPKRYPSLKRLLTLCLFVVLLFSITTIIISVTYYSEYVIYCLPFNIDGTCMIKLGTVYINYLFILIFILMVLYLFKTTFIERSAFLEEAGKKRQIFERFITVIAQLDEITRQQWVGSLGDKVYKYIGDIKDTFYKIPLGNIQDDNSYMFMIKNYINIINQIDQYVNSMATEREYLELPNEQKNNARLRIKSFNLQKEEMFNIINEINRLFGDLDINYSVYDYCILHNKHILKRRIKGYLEFIMFIINYKRIKIQ